MSEELFVLRVPVISTAHLPGPNSVVDAGVLYAPYDNGWFVFIEDEPDDEHPEWYSPVHTWAQERGFYWVRFDCDGDIVDELEKYEW